MILLRIINLISIPPRLINSKKENKHSRTRKIYRGSSQCKTTSLPVTAVFHYDDKNFGPPGGGLVPPFNSHGDLIAEVDKHQSHAVVIIRINNN